VFLEAEEDSQNESGEWERGGFEEWERGEGSGESENEAPVGAPGEERDEEESSSGEEVEEEEEEEDGESEADGGREGEGEDATQVALGHNAASGNENTVVEEPGVRDISQNNRGTQCGERELLLRRVGQLPAPPPSHRHPTPHTLTPGTPTTPAVYYSYPARRQWLLELTLVLLVATLLVTVCSRLSYNWLVRLYSIVPEKPI
jgi:hypothetical protein